MSTADESTPLLERDDALDQLRDALHRAQAGEGCTLFVHGEAGVGKTALVRQFCRESVSGARVLVGTCDPLFTPSPLGPFAEIAETTGGELRDLIDAGAIPYRVASVLLEELAGGRATVLVVEDVHWADEATLDVLRILARRITDVPALLIATYRDTELEARHPLTVVLGGLASTRAVTRMRLLPLSAAGVATLARPIGLDPDTLFRLTSGNPFYVTEVLAGGGDEIPPTVRDAVLARAASLTGASRSLLEAVSVAPTGTELWLLEALVGPTRGALDECLNSGILMADDGGTIGFRHELERLTIEGTLAPDRRTELHRRTLDALDYPPVGPRDPARIAHHADEAGDGSTVLRVAPEAATRASSVGAHREAAAQYRRALRYAERLSPESRLDLLQQYSRECYLTDELDEATRALTEAEQCCRDLGDPVTEAEMVRARADILWCPGRGKEAREMALRAISMLERNPPGSELARAYESMAFLCQMNADLVAARHWSDRAIAAAEETGDPGIVGWVSGGAAFLDVWSGMPGAREEVAHRADLFARSGQEADAAMMFDSLVIATAYTAPFPVARRYIEEGLAHARRQGLDLVHLYLLAYRSRLELDEGRWYDATQTAELVLGERFVSTVPRTLALVTLGLVRARRGDPDAWLPLDEARGLSEPTEELPRIAPVAAARAEAAWLARGPADVSAETEAPYRLARARSAPHAIGELALLRRRAGIDEAVPDNAAEPWHSQLAGDWRSAADAWRALDCPYEMALALLDGGEPEGLREALGICSELGARPLASVVTRRLRELGVSAPRGPRASTRANPAGLTRRETEILTLVADGLRNGEIAEQLVLSRRTVDHHVSAILRKLGAVSRGDAVARAQRLGLTS